MLSLCGLGYWVQGFRCFPWLALNFHMAHNLNFNPSTLQLVQNSANFPMVAKPLYGILSDAFYIAGPHRIPYICIGVSVLLQILSWGQLALIPVTGQTLPSLMACVLLSNFGASIEEVSKDALVTEHGQKHRIKGLQSYSLMALAVGGILECLGLSHRQTPTGKSMTDNIRKHLSGLMIAISEDTISKPLTWILTSIAMVPILSVRQINAGIHISNEVFTLCFSGLAETLAQFKILPFMVLLATLCPQGCEGSFTSFVASTVCLSSLVGGFWGVGLAALLGIKGGDYTSLPVGLLIQFVAALLPLGWIYQLPMSCPAEKEMKKCIDETQVFERVVGSVRI
ncbi:Histidine decarboxylase [Gossypium arboreum]|uniref:Histidine decarboxylase n=1 Tax=Gossypium arboreum TaxID=29729 RepID=A0A0B0N3J1_GOSAR|nr:Histidine decarboxylase [Gossypium arboreum]